MRADITTLALDAIVNAANSSLLGGGGVDGAIHRAAGPATARGVPDAGWLPHRAGPHHARLSTFRRATSSTLSGPCGGVATTANRDLLAACYRHSLRLAVDHGLSTLAFPAISCGAYGYPLELAIPVALGAVRGFAGLAR